MIDYDFIDDWDPRVCRLALTVEADRARHAAYHVCRFGGSPCDRQKKWLRREIGSVRRLLGALRGDQSPFVSSVRAFSDALTEHGEVPSKEFLPQVVALEALIRKTLHADLVSPPADADDWARRASWIASKPWIGNAVWGCPWRWLPLLERSAIHAEAWLQNSQEFWDAETRTLAFNEGKLQWHAPMMDELSAITQFACLTSEYVCIVCGGEGARRGQGHWRIALCNAHQHEAGVATIGDARSSAAHQQRRSA